MPNIFEISEEQKHQLAALFEIGRTIVSSLDHEEILERILDSCAELMQAKICTIRMLNKETGMLELVASYGLAKEFLQEIESDIALGDGVVGRVVQDRSPYPIADIQHSPFKYADLAREQQLRSLLSVPIILHDKATGGLTIYSQQPHTYDSGEIAVMKAITRQAALAIENAELYENVLSSLRSMNKILEAKDKWLKGHGDRVRAVSVALAKKLGFSKEVVKLLERVVPLHDIGKVALDDGLINKEAPLTADEQKLIRTHVLVGEEILRPIHFFRPGLPLVRNHHENFDGSGYPDGLKGGQIPEEVRLLTITDAWDAMTSDRPHKHGLGKADAMGELERGAGRQFDPEILRVFLEMLKAGQIQPACGRE